MYCIILFLPFTVKHFHQWQLLICSLASYEVITKDVNLTEVFNYCYNQLINALKLSDLDMTDGINFHV